MVMETKKKSMKKAGKDKKAKKVKKRINRC